MIALAALKSKGAIAAAIGAALLAAWGGLGWYGKSQAERAHADYRLEQQKLVNAQQQRIAELQAQQAIAASRAAAQYRKGVSDAETKLGPEIAALDAVNRRLAQRLRQHPGPDPDPLPATAEPPSRAAGPACTDRPRDLDQAAHRVARAARACVADLGIAVREIEKLKALQGWVEETSSEARGPGSE